MIPVFPLPGALLLPRGQMPLNIFEPRYLDMVDDALRANRIIGMIQPDPEGGGTALVPKLYGVGCAGRITQFAETGDGRYLITLSGIARFRVEEEAPTTLPYRLCRVTFLPFAADFVARAGEDEVDRAAVSQRPCAPIAEATDLELDWEGVKQAPNEALVNALAMMSPFGPKEKQALLEAPDLKTRAEMLVAITEIELARGRAGAARSRRCSSEDEHGGRDPGRGDPHRPEAARDPGLPADQGPARLRRRAAQELDQPRRPARLSDPRRHPDHAARGGAPADGLGARPAAQPLPQLPTPRSRRSRARRARRRPRAAPALPRRSGSR